MNLKFIKKPIIQSIVFFVSAIILFSCAPKPATEIKTTAEPAKSDYYVAAYIWPSCHHDERFGDILWPDGTGEWEVIKIGNPRFDGHYQPRQPLWGYEMDNDPKVMGKWIDAACFCWVGRYAEISGKMYLRCCTLSQHTQKFCSLTHQSKTLCRQPSGTTQNNHNQRLERVGGRKYLLPDMLNGYGYLEAVKKVITGEFENFEKN